MDTSVKTAGTHTHTSIHSSKTKEICTIYRNIMCVDTGYLQRRIMKSLEAYVTEYDGTVRDTSKNVLDFVYGGDGCDAQYLERVDLWFLKSGVALSTYFTVELEYEQARALIQECIRVKLSYTSQELVTISYLPVNVTLHLAQAPVKVRSIDTDLTSPFICRTVAALVDELATQTNRQTLFLRTSLCFFLRSNHVLTKYAFTQRTFTAFVNTLRICYDRAVVHPGEFVGILAAESVGQPCTQLTLNTFHSAGIAAKNVTLGVPRIKELIDARKNIRSPSTTVYLRDAVNQSKNLVKALRERVVFTTLADVVTSTEILYEPTWGQTDSLDPVDQFMVRMADLLRDPAEFPGYSRYCIRVVLDKAALTKKELTIENVRDIVRQYLGPNGQICLFQASEVNMPVWMLRFRMAGIEDMREHLRIELLKRQGEDVDRALLDFERNLAHLFLDHLSAKVKLCGITGIAGAMYDQQPCVRYNGALGVSTEKEFVILTQGSNLRQLWQLPMVEWVRTYSNDLFETYDVLGIEAAAVLLFQEIRKVLSFDGSYVNDRHIMLITHCMTASGSLMGLNRHGLNKLATGPLVKASFEQSMDVLVDAAVFGEHNPVNSVSDNIMCGQRVPGGTGKPQLLMDPKYMSMAKQKAATPVPPRYKVMRTYYSTYLTQSVNRPTDIEFDYSVPDTPVCTSPAYTPLSPAYNPCSPVYASNSPTYVPESPTYSPESLINHALSRSPESIFMQEGPVLQSSGAVQDYFTDTFKNGEPEAKGDSQRNVSRGDSIVDSWKTDSLAYWFVQKNNIGCPDDKYIPSSPRLDDRVESGTYHPSSPMLQAAQLQESPDMSKQRATGSTNHNLYCLDTGQLDFEALERMICAD